MKTTAQKQKKNNQQIVNEWRIYIYAVVFYYTNDQGRS